LNLDAFTGFYIEYGENYDDSDNYSLSTLESPYQVDTFEGYAVAGKLPFKNVYSGMYSDYVLTDGSPALWLTPIDRLLAVEDKYFDVSFIKNIRGEFWVIIDKYVADYLTLTEVTPYSDNGIGVYRIPITADANYDYFCIRVYTPGAPASAGPPSTSLDALSSWINAGGPNPGNWTLSATPDTSVNGNGGVEGYVAGAIATGAGFSYEFSVQFEIFGANPINVDIIFALLDASYNEIDTETFTYIVNGVKNETFTLMAASAGTYLGMRIVNNTPFDTKSFDFQVATYNAPSAPSDDIAAQTMTEEICIDMVESCDVVHGVSDGDLRLREEGEGNFRELE
jgi:hypothetical protein